ncbi:hypothetical protein LS68_004955 [Helicobacter sp. MIT 05-5293]|uniref:hypothetical protein n=1 Tax=Helicobacter sp. MIT 05-5293 TaxID=1548149 RepID=UPI00051CFB44|nr:hypothetical protein [Helicobacter sp. MIT 05-5293]TLD80828.1 hypothetical protein LS68_004955 [Helicobacter sp. MIT 05-5293]
MKIKAIVLAGLLALGCYGEEVDINNVSIDHDSFVDKSLLLGIAHAYCFLNVTDKVAGEMFAKGNKLNSEQFKSLGEVAGGLCKEFIEDNVKIFVNQNVNGDSFKKGLDYGKKIFYEMNNRE